MKKISKKISLKVASSSSSSSFEESSSSPISHTTGISLPNIDLLSYHIKSLIYEMKELSIRIISLIKIELNLNLYEKQKLKQLILNFKDSFILKLQHCLNNENNLPCSSMESMSFIHYIMVLIISLKLPFHELFSSETDNLIKKILKKSIKNSEFDLINTLKDILQLYPSDMFPLTLDLLSRVDANNPEQLIQLTRSSISSNELLTSNISNKSNLTINDTIKSTKSGNLLNILPSITSSKSFTRLTSLFRRQSSRIHDSSNDCTNTDHAID